jgi:hypothetical protein
LEKIVTIYYLSVSGCIAARGAHSLQRRSYRLDERGLIPASAGTPVEISTKSSGRGVKLITCLHLVLSLRICGAILQFPNKMGLIFNYSKVYVFMALCLTKQRRDSLSWHSTRR